MDFQSPEMTRHYVYVMRGKFGGTKVGFTGDPLTRIEALRCHYTKNLNIHGLWLCESLAHAILVEDQTKQLFRQHQIHGEWFNVSAQQACETVTYVMGRVARQKASVPGSSKLYLPVPANSEWRFGYARDFCEVPLLDQRQWLEANNIEGRKIYEDLTARTSHNLQHAIVGLEFHDLFYAWSPAVFGSTELHNQVMQAAERYGTRVVFAEA